MSPDYCHVPRQSAIAETRVQEKSPGAVSNRWSKHQICRAAEHPQGYSLGGSGCIGIKWEFIRSEASQASTIVIAGTPNLSLNLSKLV